MCTFNILWKHLMSTLNCFDKSIHQFTLLEQVWFLIESYLRCFPVITSLIHKGSHKSPTKILFDVGSRRISIFIMNIGISLRCSGKITRIMRRISTRTRLIKKSSHRCFPVVTSSILKGSHKSPTKSLFDVGSRRISIFIVNTCVSLGCSGNITWIMRRTLSMFSCNPQSVKIQSI